MLRSRLGLLFLASLGADALASTPGERPGLPFTFVENLGQWDVPARFVARVGGTLVGVEEDRLSLLFRSRTEGGERGALVRMVFEGAAGKLRLEGEGRREGTHNFFLGDDPTRWRRDLPGYEAVLCGGLYPGVDLRVRKGRGGIEYDLLLSPGADLGSVVVRCEGIEDLRTEGDGLAFRTALGEIRQSAPVAWKVRGSGPPEPIECRARVLDATRFTFDVCGLGAEDAGVIDPGLDWATYLGGSSYEFAYGLTLQSSGAVTVTGETASVNFPTSPGAYDTSYNGFAAPTIDVYVARLGATGTSLVYATYLGGSGGDKPFSIAEDATGAVTVAGNADTGFPVTPGAYDTSLSGQSDAFVTRLNPTGNALVFSTFLGGGSGDIAQALALEPSGHATLTGVTSSSNFPATPGAFATAALGPSDGFVARLNPTGSALVFSTFLGGSNGEVPQGLALDGSGAAFVAGVTSSGDFPVTPGALDTTAQGSSDVFVTRLDATGSGLLYSTLIGGNGGDVAEDVAVDASGGATVVGVQSSSDFPTTPGAFRTTAQGNSDVFVARLNAAGTALLSSTLLGGSGGDVGRGVRLGALGEAAVVGDSSSSDFPTTPGAFDSTAQGSSDAFLALVNPTGTGLLYSTYLGGSGGDGAYAVGLGGADSATIAGVTNSSDFPATSGALDASLAGSGDGVLARFTLPPCGASPYGASTAACSGPIQIGVDRCPQAGDPLFGVTCLYAPPAAAGVLLLGVGQDLAGTPILGITLHVSLALPVFPLAAASNGVGVATRPIPIPGGTSGAQVYLQFVWLNPAGCGGPGTFSASNALDLTVQ
ncbi:MAG: hypothetical protein L0323_03950 [Planctomycetes bacterium]|nr:hypothetical protein [Planctomycetota bacterium]